MFLNNAVRTSEVDIILVSVLMTNQMGGRMLRLVQKCCGADGHGVFDLFHFLLYSFLYVSISQVYKLDLPTETVN
jgi:hypothetical protein